MFKYEKKVSKVASAGKALDKFFEETNALFEDMFDIKEESNKTIRITLNPKNILDLTEGKEILYLAGAQNVLVCLKDKK